MTQTLAPDQWLDLCARQHARAMAGDQRAAAWCARYAPAVDVQNLWAGYTRQRELVERMKLHMDFLADWGDGLDKLWRGHWSESSPETRAWCERLIEHARKVRRSAPDFDWSTLSPEQQAPILDALQDLLEAMARVRGLNPDAMTPEQGQAFARALAEGGPESASAFAERLKAEHPDVCLTAGKEQAG